MKTTKQEDRAGLVHAVMYLILAAIVIPMFHMILIAGARQDRPNPVASVPGIRAACKLADGRIVNGHIASLEQDQTVGSVRIKFDNDDVTLTIPADNIIVYHDRETDTSGYISTPSGITIIMPDDTTEELTGWARPADPGFTDPHGYVLFEPFYCVTTGSRDYYATIQNLIIEQPD